MGRPRIPELDKKVPLSTKVKKSLLDELRAELEKRNLTMTEFIEQSIQKFLEKE